MINLPEINEKEWPQILAILIVLLAPVSLGTFLAWTSPTILILTSQEKSPPFLMTMDEASYLTVIPAICISLSCLAFPKLIEIFGRKKMICAVAIPQLLGWLLIATCINKWMLYASRVLSGIAEGWVYAVVPTYIGEISTPKIRGTWGVGLSAASYFGFILVNYVASVLDIHTAGFVLGTMPILFFVGFIFMPESPYWLIKQRRTEEARNALAWLRGTPHIDKEFALINQDLDRQLSEPGEWKDLVTIESNRKALLLGFLTRFMQQFGGLSAISSYTQFIFVKSGMNWSDSGSAILCSAVLTIANIGSSVVVNRAGRRITIILSATICCVMHVLIAIFFYISDYTTVDISNVRWLLLLCLLIYISVYAVGLGCVSLLLLSELFSTSIKSKALAIQNINYGIWYAASNNLFHVLTDNFGLYVPFLMYAVSSFIGAILCFILLPETKGKRLEEVQQMLKENRLH